MPKVYVTNDSGLDFSNAARYGELVFLTKGKVDPFRPHVSLDEIAKGLQGFDYQHDYLLPAGAQIAVAWTFLRIGILMEGLRGGPHVFPIKTLMFDSKKVEYICRTVAV